MTTLHRSETRRCRTRAWRRAAPLALGFSALPALAPAAHGAEAQVLKIATVAPAGSSWHRILRDGFEEWESRSEGTLRVRLFPAGVAGDDLAVISRIRSEALDGAVLGPVGLGSLDPSAYALGIPLLVETDAEARCVLEGLRADLDGALSEQGFVTLSWFRLGWVRFFTAEAAPTPEALQKLRLLVLAGEEARSLWAAAGFAPTGPVRGGVTRAIESGRVQAVPMPPGLALLSQTYLRLPHMTDVAWQPIWNAVVLRRSAWEALPEPLRRALRKVSRDTGDRLDAELRSGEPSAVDAMVERGLTLVPVDETAKASWRNVAASMYPSIRDAMVPAAAFDAVIDRRDRMRAARGTCPAPP